MGSQNTETLTASVPKGFPQALRAYAAQHHLTVSAILMHALAPLIDFDLAALPYTFKPFRSVTPPVATERKRQTDAINQSRRTERATSARKASQ